MKTNADYNAKKVKAGRSIVRRLARMFEPRRYRTTATITSVQRDGAQRVTGALATIDGAESQPVAISFGAPVSPGDTYQVENRGHATSPSWVAVRRLSSPLAIPEAGESIILPTPTGLALESGIVQVGDGPMAWIYASCNSVDDRYGRLLYRFQVRVNDPTAAPQEFLTVDLMLTSTIVAAIDDTQTIIPHDDKDNKFAKFGRIKLESELIDYDDYTYGNSDSGTGTGGTNTFTDSGASWETDEWAGFALTVSAVSYLITSNTSTVLTVVGTPASGAYSIDPCFYNCTRGAGSTSAAAHANGKTFIRRSVGLMLGQFPPDTDYNVRVRTERDADNSVSNWSAYVSTTTDVDTVAPGTPTGMGATPLSTSSVRVWWDANTEPDLDYYEVDASMSAGGASVSPFPQTTGNTPSLVVVWGYAATLYWRVRAVDRSGNESSYTVWQTAEVLTPASPDLLNGDFEDGTGSPDNWTLNSAGVIATTWHDMECHSPTRCIQFAVSAGSGSDTYYTALISDYIAVELGVLYTLGCLTRTYGVQSNVLKFTVFQYQDAVGTPAANPYRQFDFTQQLQWDYGYHGGFMILPSDTDVTHIRVAIEIHLLATYNQTLWVDDFYMELFFIYQPLVGMTLHDHSGDDAGGLVDHGDLSGLADDDHSAVYPGLAQSETVSGLWTFSRSTSAPFACVSGAAKVDYLDADKIDGYEASAFPRKAETATITGAWTFQADPQFACNLDFTSAYSITTASGSLSLAPAGSVSVAANLNPSASDSWDIGTATLLWRHGHLSELHTIIFAKETISLVGGGLRVGYNVGTFPSAVGEFDTTIDFGQSMTPTHFVECRAELKHEYIQVGTLVSGTTYNVTRALGGTTAVAWPDGHPYSVLGYDGTGRIELNAYDTPMLRILLQGTSATSVTEVLRAGDLDGSFGISSTLYGLGVGNYGDGNFLRYDPTNGFVIQGGDGAVVVNDGGITLDMPTDFADPASLKFRHATDTSILMGVSAKGPSEGYGYGYINVESTDSAGIVQLDIFATTPNIDTQLSLYANDSTDVASISLTAHKVSVYKSVSGGNLLVAGGLYVGGTSTTPDEGTLTTTDYIVALGGLHVGGTSDPGTDNLLVDAAARIGTGLYVGSTATAPTADCIHLDGNLVGTTPTALADDTAMSFTPPNSTGAILTLARSGSAGCWGMAVYRATASPWGTEMMGASTFTATTGALTGTTGADGEFTVSAHTDGKIYIENRLGISVSFHYILFGA